MTRNSLENRVVEFLPVLILGYKRFERIVELVNHLLSIGVKKIYISMDAQKEVEKYEDSKAHPMTLQALLADSLFDGLVTVNYFSRHLGTKNAVISGIDWFFSKEDAGIILEDDIFPSPQFIKLASDYLHLVEKDQNIASISAMNLVPEKKISHKSSLYRRSIFFSCWGWATSKSKWSQFRSNFDVTEVMEGVLETVPRVGNNYWEKVVLDIIENKLQSWAFEFELYNMSIGRHSLVPCRNLAINLGIGDAYATRTTSKKLPYWFPTKLQHFSGDNVWSTHDFPDRRADEWMQRHHYSMTKFAKVCDRFLGLEEKLAKYKCRPSI